jgi:hypothetical protein
MKRSLRRGKYSILNLYFQTDLAGSVLGKCTLLSSIGPGTTNSSFYANDRCRQALCPAERWTGTMKA